MKNLFVFAAIAVFAHGAQAVSIFDFESETATATFGGRPGALTSLSMTHNALTITITRSGGTAFDVVDSTTFPATAAFPLSWGARSLDPFSNSSTDDWFVADFSVALTAVELEMMDFGSDSDTAVMEVYSGAGASGTLLYTSTQAWGTLSGPDWVGLGWASGAHGGGSALSIRFRGGSTSFPNSMFVDNILANPVPEPASMLALAVGVGALLRRRK